MPALETERLVIRAFAMDDLEAIHEILDLDLGWTSPGRTGETAREERRAWLQWSVMNDVQLAALMQPPYGDRAVIRKEDGVLVGSCGFVPELKPFGLLPSFGGEEDPSSWLTIPQVGLFYAFSTAYRGRGYATEAARAMAGYGFRVLRLRRIVATTDHDNEGSIGVMRRLGMRIERNPYPDPPWLQVCGVLDNPDLRVESSPG
jgi:RimJ/RimL family protein N-acetyltransferase